MSNINMGRKSKTAAIKRSSKIDVSTQTHNALNELQPVICLKRLEIHQTVTELDDAESQLVLQTYQNFEHRLSKNTEAHSTMAAPKRRSINRPGPLCSKNREAKVVKYNEDLEIPIVLDNSANNSSASSQNLEPIPEQHTPENLNLDNSHLVTDNFSRVADIDLNNLLSLSNVEAFLAEERTNRQGVNFEKVTTVISPHSHSHKEENRNNPNASSNENKSESVSYEFIKVQANVVYIHNHFYRK